MINYIEKGAGLFKALNDAGHVVYHENRIPVYDIANESAIQAIIDSYDPIPLAQEEAKQRILEQSEQAIDDLVLSKYPRFEIETWTYQAMEAEAYTKDKSALTPRLDRMAAQRGVIREDFIALVSAKVISFSDLSSDYAGQRQKIEDQIASETDFSIIQSINFVAP